MSDIVCNDCGHDFVENDDREHRGSSPGYVSFHTLMGHVRGDLHVECPACGDLLEAEIQVITTY